MTTTELSDSVLRSLDNELRPRRRARRDVCGHPVVTRKLATSDGYLATLSMVAVSCDSCRHSWLEASE